MRFGGAAIAGLCAVTIVSVAGFRAPKTPVPCPACSDFYAYATSDSVTRRLPTTLATLGTADASRQVDLAIQKIVMSSDADGLGRFYRACLDTAAIEKRGIASITSDLARIDSIDQPRTLFRMMGELHRSYDATPFAIGVAADAQDPRVNRAVVIFAGATGLPNRDYYLNTDARSTGARAAYESYMRDMFVLSGEDGAAALSRARAVLRLETELAARQPTPAELRDPRVVSMMFTLPALQQVAPHAGWLDMLVASGADTALLRTMNVRNTNAALSGLDSLVANTPASDWRSLLRWDLLQATTTALPRALVDRRAAFNASIGLPDRRIDRATMCAQEAQSAFSDVIGREYVRQYFSPAARAEAQRIAGTLRDVLRDHVRSMTWISDAAKGEALSKLDSLVLNIGYADTPTGQRPTEDYQNDYLANRRTVRRATVRASWLRLATPNVRGAWTGSPAAYRANYVPQQNALVVTAAVLQPPTFVPGGDVATNYGAMGAILAHEMTHMFDVIVSRFDASGRLRNWWGSGDAARYDSLTQPLIEQYGKYPIDSTRYVNGRTTLGENISDLGGVGIAFEAFQREMRRQPQPTLVGFTPEQRFFMAYARAHKGTEFIVSSSDPAYASHSPPRWRVNGVLSQMPEFAAAFGVKEGDPMARSAKQRVRIW